MKRCFALVLLALALLPARSEAQVASFCNQSTIYDASTSGATQMVAAVGTGTGRIFVCGYSIFVGSTATNVGLVSGTGTNCATGQVKQTPAWQFAANEGLVDTAGPITFPSAAALCVLTSAGNAVQVRVSWIIIP